MDMTVTNGPDNFAPSGAVIPSRIQGGGQGREFFRRPLGEIGQGAILDLAVFAVGFPQQNGGFGVPVRHDGYEHTYSLGSVILHASGILQYLHGYILHTKTPGCSVSAY